MKTLQRRGVPEQLEGFIDNSQGLQMVYQMGKKVKNVYELGLLNAAELRIMQVYELWKQGIKPWEWDYERYPDNEMFGRFYPDDWANLMGIESMINDREGAAASRARSQAGARS